MSKDAAKTGLSAERVLFRGTKPLPLAVGMKPLKVASHEQLMRALPVAAARVAEHPGFSVMFLLNPVLALQRYGVALSPVMAQHVLHMLRHPPALRERRDALEASLRKALGEPAKPLNAPWLARLVFVRQKLAPLLTVGQKPSYRSPANAAMVAALKARLPTPTNRYARYEKRIGVTSRLGLAPMRESRGRLDMSVPAPRLERAAARPVLLSLEEAWFYKDLDPIVRDAVELGAIQASARRFLSPDGFRKAVSGEMSTAFRAWISAVRINDRPRGG
jgi:hypothetical protein